MRDQRPAWWERHGPRLPSHGIRAHTQRGAFGKTWWASRWVAALEQLVNPARLARGRTYARKGQVISMDIGSGGVKAVVQGTRPEPYTISIKFRPLDDATWQRVIEAMAAEAIYAARLLSGEMPEQIEEVFASAGAALFPTDQSDMQTACSCPDIANPCKHIAAVHYLLGERFDDDPFLMFLMRGRSRDDIVNALRALRSADDPSAAVDTEDQEADEPPLDLTTFWSSSDVAGEIALHFALPEVDGLVVKRLGEAPFVRDQALFTASIERMYAHIGQHALLLALGDVEPTKPAESDTAQHAEP